MKDHSYKKQKIFKDSIQNICNPQHSLAFHTGANLVIIPKISRKSNIFLSNNSTDHTYILTYLSHLDFGKTRVGMTLCKGVWEGWIEFFLVNFSFVERFKWMGKQCEMGLNVIIARYWSVW